MLSLLEYIIISLQLYDHISSWTPGFQQGQFDALLKRSYLAPNEGDATYDQ